MKNIIQIALFVVILSIIAMGIMSFGSFNPMDLGFWISIMYGFFTVLFTELVLYYFVKKRKKFKEKKI